MCETLVEFKSLALHLGLHKRSATRTKKEKGVYLSISDSGISLYHAPKEFISNEKGLKFTFKMDGNNNLESIALLGVDKKDDECFLTKQKHSNGYEFFTGTSESVKKIGIFICKPKNKKYLFRLPGEYLENVKAIKFNVADIMEKNKEAK